MEGKILIVDDDIDTLQLVGTMLEKQGFKIIAANNGEKAIKLASKETPDLILLDIMMPGIDGFEVTRRLRSMTKTAFIPIILFTAKAQVDDKLEGFEAGADDYLTKPTHPAELIARVRTILARPKYDGMYENREESNGKTGEVIGVIAAKGGLGVSTLALNLGVAILNQTKEYVTVAELQPGRGDIGIFLGYKLAAEGLNKLLSKNVDDIKIEDVEEQLITHGTGIQLLLSSFQPEHAHFTSSSEEIEVIIKHLSKINPYTLLDLGTGLPESSVAAIKQCNQLIIVVEPTGFNIIQTKALLENLKDFDFDADQIKIVLFSRVRMDITVPLEQIQTELGYAFAGTLTPSPELAYQATVRQQPIIAHQPDSLTAQQIMKIASQLTEKVKA